MPFWSTKQVGVVSEYQKWDWITLSDFKATSCWSPLSYIWLWVLAIIAVAVYGADTFTAINLLAFDKWNSEFEPTIPFDVSKWIFAGCIIFSWILAIIEWVRAIRIIRRASVAESYLDPLAVTLQSMRMGREGRGWRRFLVFAELTKSRKGADYVALFVYFQFKGAIRIIIAEGPRQVINALTLYSVAQANLIPVGDHASTQGHSDFVQFWLNVKTMANEHTEQGIILSSMLFTLVIWIISALSFLLACILYITFLWHYIPSDDRSLSNYCRKKIERRLARIVDAKVQKALAKREARLKKEEEKAIKNGNLDFVPIARKPTLPTLSDAMSDISSDVGTIKSYNFGRNDTMSSREPKLPFVIEEEVSRPSSPARTLTSQSSVSEFGTSLVSHAAPMGRIDSNNNKNMMRWDSDNHSINASEISLRKDSKVGDDASLRMPAYPVDLSSPAPVFANTTRNMNSTSRTPPAMQRPPPQRSNTGPNTTSAYSGWGGPLSQVSPAPHSTDDWYELDDRVIPMPEVPAKPQYVAYTSRSMDRSPERYETQQSGMQSGSIPRAGTAPPRSVSGPNMYARERGMGPRYEPVSRSGTAPPGVASRPDAYTRERTMESRFNPITQSTPTPPPLENSESRTYFNEPNPTARYEPVSRSATAPPPQGISGVDAYSRTRTPGPRYDPVTRSGTAPLPGNMPAQRSYFREASSRYHSAKDIERPDTAGM